MTFTDYYQQARERLSPALRSMPMIRLLTRRLERRIIWIWGLGSRLDFFDVFQMFSAGDDEFMKTEFVMSTVFTGRWGIRSYDVC